ncbi:S phase cyclin A-associated protein in the endoplasmic reticulum isoform X3 [Cryptotermes secundus]|uniref:S phase cyclin A-associated protein in the endoplasmic reticulum isoform X3 n=1 Tax=Cryptotermes secundus TaxID=105785 RepID=UPI001454DD40|nr:S phase cyclin A-associated protein in the endoplasmic reticulum isoform X3 [Cryptotermes secundus]
MEDVRLLIQEEGRAARNLIAFHVPVDHTLSDLGKVLTRKPPTSPRLQSEGKKEDGLRLSKRSCESSKAGSRIRSASTGRDKKSELQARYWAFLFGNLQRAVDEIYQTCETDESVSECKEVILVLENYTRDFHNLIEWFRLKWEYENTPPPQRPTSLAWEVRKPSPGKIRPVTNMETVTVESHTGTNVNRGDTPTLTVQNVNMQKRDYISLRPYNGANSNGAMITDVDVGNNTSSSDSVGISNTVPLNDGNETKIHDQTVLNLQGSNSLTEVTDNTVQNVNNDINKRLAVIGNMEVSEQQPECGTTFTVGNVILDSNDPGCRKDVCGVRELNFENKTEDGVHDGEMAANIQVRNSTIYGIDTTTIKEGSENNYANKDFEKVDEGNESEKPRKPCCDIVRDISDEDKRDNNDVGSGKIDEVKLHDVPVMIHQASQTDLEECVEDADGLRFLSIPQKPMDTTPAVVSKPTQVINVVSKTAALGKSPVAPLRAGVRTSLAPVVRPQPSVRPAYATVSRLSSPASTRNHALSHANLTTPRPYSSPRLVQSRTSTDVRPAGKGTALRKLPVEPTAGALKSQRPTSLIRQSRPGGQQCGVTAMSLRPKVENISETGSSLDKRNGSNSSLNSSTSSGARSWADKVKGKEASRTTVSVEVLPRTGTGNEDDDTQGWETVKSRSRSRVSPASKVEGLSSSLSLSASSIKCRPLERKGSVGVSSRVYTAKSRFQQPSAATSLPALALVEVEVQPQSLKDGKKIAEVKRNVPTLTFTQRNSTSIAKMKKDVKDIKEDNNKKLLKSIKTSSLSNKNVNGEGKNEKHIKSEDAGNKRISKITLDSDDNREKGHLAQTLMKKDNDELEIIDYKIEDEQEEKVVRKNSTDAIILDVQLEDILEEKNLFNEEELRKSKELCAEEAMLRKEIYELESTEIEADTETDETETDGEATVGPEEDDEERQKEVTEIQNSLIPEDTMTLEARYETQLEGMSYAERLNALEQLEEMESRHPGRALELHQKLSSPSRRRTLPETLRCFQAKQAQAKEKRERLMHEKSQRLRELLNKVEEVKAAQAQLTENKRARLEMKLKRAEVNRRLHLKGIVKKAHDEEEKLKEIAFINELEAQNKRHDFMALCQEQEERLQGIQEERQRKQEEKAAKEAAVEERRRVLEAERQERLEKMQEMRRKREERVGRNQQEKEKERQELAREKARGREERLSALHAAQLATQEELQKKIQQKQEEYARRHEENIEHIRQRALESSILRCSTDDVAPRLAPYDTQKLCEVCNVLIGSEVYLLSHLRGRKHQEAVQRQHEGVDPSREDLASYNIRHIVDAPADKIDPKIALDKERQKALKKRCKKIRLRMAARGQEYESKKDPPIKMESPNKARIQKCLRDVEKLHSSQGKGQWPNTAITSLERALCDISRILDKQNSLDQMAFQALNGFATLSSILNLALDVPLNMASYLPPKSFVTTCNAYNLACRNHATNSKYVLFSNKISTVLDLLLHRLTVLIPDRSRMMSASNAGGHISLPVDSVEL